MNRTSSIATAFALVVIANLLIAFTKTNDAPGVPNDDGSDGLAPCKKTGRFRYEHALIGDVGSGAHRGKYGAFGKYARQFEVMNGVSCDSARFDEYEIGRALETGKEGSKEISCGYVLPSIRSCDVVSM